HGEHLVRNAVDVAQRLDQANARLGQGGWGAGLLRLVEGGVDPADQIAFGNIADEQIEAIGNLVEMAVSQGMGWQRAGVDVVRLSAGAARLLVPAVMEVPIALQFWAGWSRV